MRGQSPHFLLVCHNPYTSSCYVNFNDITGECLETSRHGHRCATCADSYKEKLWVNSKWALSREEFDKSREMPVLKLLPANFRWMNDRRFRASRKNISAYILLLKEPLVHKGGKTKLSNRSLRWLLYKAILESWAMTTVIPGQRRIIKKKAIPVFSCASVSKRV